MERFLAKESSINDVRQFLTIFDQPSPPNVQFLPSNVQFFGVISYSPSLLKSDIINGRSLTVFACSHTHFCTQLHTLSHTCTCARTLTVSNGTNLHTNPSKPIIWLPSSGFITFYQIFLFFFIFHLGEKLLLLIISEPLYLVKMGLITPPYKKILKSLLNPVTFRQKST